MADMILILRGKDCHESLGTNSAQVGSSEHLPALLVLSKGSNMFVQASHTCLQEQQEEEGEEGEEEKKKKKNKKNKNSRKRSRKRQRKRKNDKKMRKRRKRRAVVLATRDSSYLTRHVNHKNHPATGMKYSLSPSVKIIRSRSLLTQVPK